MRYRSERLREALAAEYVVGTLRGRSRRRFEHALRRYPALRGHVIDWQNRLSPLDDAMRPVQPHARVWSQIERRIGSGRESGPAGFWSSLAFWRVGALVGLMLSLVLGALLVSQRGDEPLMVVVMADQQDKPAMTVSWEMEPHSERRLRIRVIGHASMAPETAWELWMLPEGAGKPVSLGLITTHQTQIVRLPPALAQAVDRARGLAMSVEPAGGSPTGTPTGPVLYQGQCVQL